MSALSIVKEAAGKWCEELLEYIIPDHEKRGSEEEETQAHRDEADAITAALAQLQPMSIYLLGDETAPDKFGVIYDNEDEADTAAYENERTVWRVPVVPDWENAEEITP